jgi:hypothetical protein
MGWRAEGPAVEVDEEMPVDHAEEMVSLTSRM